MSMVAALGSLIQDRSGMDKDPVIVPAAPPRSPPYGLVKDRRCYQDDMVGKTLNDKLALVAEGKLPATPATASATATPTGASRRYSISSSGYGEDFFFDAPESPFEGSETSSQCDYAGIDSAAALEATADSADSAAPPQPDRDRYLKAQETLEIVLQKLRDGGLELPDSLLEAGLARSAAAAAATAADADDDLRRDRVQDLDIAGQLQIKRMVEAAVARGAARAECEEQLLAELESKNSEIETKSREVTRLRDKVRYNELLHREISQRNQEAIEMARSKRRARQKLVRWAVASASAAIVGGIGAALVYKYSPPSMEFWKPSKSESSSSSSSSSSESGS